jgi:type IV pilus assembly protein PilC
MDYSYVAYTRDRKLAKGKISAANAESASKMLGYSGYQVLNLKEHTPFLNLGRLSFLTVRKIKPIDVILFSRQLALLLESGVDIVSSLELLEDQVDNRVFKKVLREVAADIRGGSSLSMALSKHPKAFPPVYARAISAGEQGGNLETVLRNISDFMERVVKTEKKIKSALTYPIIVVVVATGVIALMVVFVLPTFTDLYSSLGGDLPLITRMLISTTTWLTDYGLYLFAGIFALFIALFFYIRTPAGKYRWDSFMLHMPVIGRIIQLSELSRACQTMALLFRAGLPLPEIMTQTVHGTNNKVVAEALTGVQRDLVRGEGLSGPMEKRKVFLPLMTQMVSVGEETGKLDNTLSTVAETYDVEADDRTTAAVNLIQPVLTIGIGLVVAFVAVALVSSMYSLYGEGF